MSEGELLRNQPTCAVCSKLLGYPTRCVQNLEAVGPVERFDVRLRVPQEERASLPHEFVVDGCVYDGRIILAEWSAYQEAAMRVPQEEEKP